MRISNLSGSLAFVSLARTAVCWNLPQFPLAEPAQTWNPVKLDDRICKSGSEQYAGTIKISETKKIFYCEFLRLPRRCISLTNLRVG